MTDAGFLSLTPQLAAAHWGWTIAFFLWFIGLSGMLMALFYFVRDKRIALFRRVDPRLRLCALAPRAAHESPVRGV